MPRPYRTPDGSWNLAALQAARARGSTLLALATAAGVSRERIRQLLHRAAARERLGLPVQSRMADFGRVSHNRPDGRSGT